MIETLIFGLIVLSSVCLWLLIEGRKSPKFLVWFIPVLLMLVTSTYVTYSSILGFPKPAIPKVGLYLSHYIDEPDWIYLWVLVENEIPMSYRIVFTKEKRQALEAVKGASAEGKFMIIKDVDEEGEKGDDGSDEENRGGFTIGGDRGFYEWDFKSSMPPKN